jgi:hypothetical protein
MKSHLASPLCFAILPLSVALLPATAAAQQVPLTGQMMDSNRAVAASAAPAPMPTSTYPAPALGTAPASAAVTAPLSSNNVALPPDASIMHATAAPAEQTYVPTTAATRRPYAHVTVIGETTQNLLRMQADGSEAGQPLPMLGAEASSSYARYLKSFNHDIPEFYKTTVGKDSNSSSGGE